MFEILTISGNPVAGRAGLTFIDAEIMSFSLRVSNIKFSTVEVLSFSPPTAELKQISVEILTY